jgi:hypothetical protein
LSSGFLHSIPDKLKQLFCLPFYTKIPSSLGTKSSPKTKLHNGIIMGAKF